MYESNVPAHKDRIRRDSPDRDILCNTSYPNESPQKPDLYGSASGLCNPPATVSSPPKGPDSSRRATPSLSNHLLIRATANHPGQYVAPHWHHP